MEDLISRSALLESLIYCEDLKGRRTTEVVAKLINDAPTAFDLDAVVKRLEEESSFFGGKPMGTLQKHFYCEGIKRAIEIVRGGEK